MSNPPEPSKAEMPAASATDERLNRRRVLQRGLAAAPVLMTLVSRPVLAQLQCRAPSGFASGNVSTPGGAICSGRAPTFWGAPENFASWFAPYVPVANGQHAATLFTDVFADPHAQFGGQTLVAVLNNNGGPPFDVARYIVAALFNAASGTTPVLTVPAVQGIWNEFITTGFYQATATVMWDHAAIVEYLMSTMPG